MSLLEIKKKKPNVTLGHFYTSSPPMTSSTHYIVIDSSLTPHDVTENPNC